MSARPLNVAVTAMGGQGGGVLAGWILQVAEAGGWTVQTTSVPGVAQRTGATVYSIALHPPETGERRPVLGLMPVPGDVDVCLSAELMEAGRAIQRGFVTPDRTLLITSTHRDYAVVEKSALDDGRRDGDAVLDAAGRAAERLVAFDMEALARDCGSVISAVLLGALAGSEALPFAREAYEAAIRASGKGVDASLAAFNAGHARASGAIAAAPGVTSRGADDILLPRGLREQVAVGYDEPLRSVVTFGVERLLDYQDEAYAALYLQRLEPLVDRDTGGLPLAEEVARRLALWMAYEDTFRVAELKIRPERMARIRAEVGAEPDQLLRVTDYLHPRLEEVADSLPEHWSRRVLGWPWLRALAGRLLGRGRRVATHTVGGYLQFWLLAHGRRWRQQTPRHVREQAAIERWLGQVIEVAAGDPGLAYELARCQAMVRGYGPTHARGTRAFERIMATAADLAGTADAAATVARLREAALADEGGARLGEVLVTLERTPRATTA